MKAVYYHCSNPSNRESITADGLRDRALDGTSAAEAYGNPAGAAVYMWSSWPENSMLHGQDVWAVEVEASDVEADPSNLGPLGAVLTRTEVAPQQLRLVGQVGRSMDLDARDMDNPATAMSWARNHQTEAAAAMAQLSGMACVWVGRWDYEEDGAYEEQLAVCIAQEDVAAYERDFDECDDVMSKLRSCPWIYLWGCSC